MKYGLVRVLVLLILLAFALLPLYWMLVASLKPEGAILIGGSGWWPQHPGLGNYGRLLQDPLALRWTVNTLLVMSGSLIVGIACSLCAAYALMLVHLPRLPLVGAAMFGSYVLPQAILFLPLIRELAALHLLDSPLALVVTYPGLIIPFGTWVIWNFLRRLPRDLLDQARVDGASPMRVLVSVVLPLTRPALAAVALFGLVLMLNDYFYVAGFISDLPSKTLTGVIATLDADLEDPGFTYAAIFIGVAPLALLCAAFADRFAAGIGTGIIED